MSRLLQILILLVIIPSVTLSCKECVVRVLDWPEAMGTPKQSKYDNGYLKKLAKRFPKAIKVSGKEDMKDKILKHIKKNKCCIKKLIIMGHGSEGNISTGDGRKWESCKHIDGNKSEWEPILKDLKGKFCKKAEITLFGCKTGAGTKGAAKLQTLADFFGVPVRAPTRTVKGSEDEGSIKKDEWQRAVPKGKTPKVKAGKNILEKGQKGKGIDAGNVRKMAVYDAKGKEVAEEQEQVKFNIENPELIRRLIGSIDFEQAFNGTALGADDSAYVYMLLKDGGVSDYYLTLDWRYFGEVVEKGVYTIYPISPEGTELFKEVAIR